MPRTLPPDMVSRKGRSRGFRWERDVVPQIGPPPQTVVDRQTPSCDIYVGIMASRFGTPTDGFGSGTEKEFQDAVRQWAERGRPWILFYFHSSPALPQTSKALTQYAKVVKFREKLQRRGIHCQYDSVSDGDNSFLFLVTRHLRNSSSGWPARQHLSCRRPRPLADRQLRLP